ncbi:thioesterase family protein [Nocardioides bruguierae]|uniref:Thioesterase family protein n=1 Tax=Nocardioides bruguierae TaxID=2945102 RepID=A0A9X2IFL3_9ACTN|nr:thioesterase family protein [Nocardioides bruguierae]MCM0620574.1 thioesterase family protein [Nocardioides bruguierae]
MSTEPLAASTHEFDRQTAVRPLPGTAPDAPAGRYAAALTGGWSVGGGVNGGFQLGVVGAAVRAHLPAHSDPVSISAHYLSAGTDGPAEVEVDLERVGRLATVRARLMQGGATRIAAIGTFGDLAAAHEAAAGDERLTATPPDLPAPERCPGPEHTPPQMLEIAPMMERFEMRFDPACAGFAVGAPSGQGRLSAWFRFRDGREPDTLSLLTALDVLPPVTFDLGRPGWAPTLSLTAHVRRRPAPGWLRITQATRHLAGGMFEEDCEVWDADDHLVAQARQLALVPR